jgi:Ni,Fe-hydrogenase III large subunit
VPLSADSYSSLAPNFAQTHWFERSLFDLFAIEPKNHPRLKSVHLPEFYADDFFPLIDYSPKHKRQKYEFLETEGEGIWELPVGPIHAGIIEPGHFRFSCYGEIIVNLEIRMGYLHRGIEKRLTGVPLNMLCLHAESIASDTAAANALACAQAIENLCQIQLPEELTNLRYLALEIERAAMHIADLGGIAADIGFLGLSAQFNRLRGKALVMAEILSGSRFLRGFICPAGIRPSKYLNLDKIKALALELKDEITDILPLLLNSSSALERMSSIGIVSQSLAQDFGIIGVAGRASGINYDARSYYSNQFYDAVKFKPALQKGGDVLARTQVRAHELIESLSIIANFDTKDISLTTTQLKLPEKTPALMTSLSIVEAFRGELIHFLATDQNGNLSRYAIKDPSQTNWTALAIAIRQNLIADFPLCNKSFSLSYGGNDL